MSHDSRRSFLSSLARGASAAAVGSAFTTLGERIARAHVAERTFGFGPLNPKVDGSTGLELICLPDGFEYVSFGWTGDRLDDDSLTPPAHDGMAIIAEKDSEIILCRNHELSEPGPAFWQGQAYDRAATGGCTNLVFDREQRKLKKAAPSLSGTVKNCAGGASTWNSWLSCEETVVGPEDATESGKRFEKEHGFVFDVPIDGARQPRPIKSLGRFVHEALAIDPDTGIVYLTEDADEAGFYRMVPEDPRDLHAGGRFEMLAVKNIGDCRTSVSRADLWDVHWVEIPDRLRAHRPGTKDGSGVYGQGKQAGGLTFARLEGCAVHGGRVFITATSGGDAGAGQVWQYDPVQEQLRLLFESPGSEVLDMPDNMTVSPRGGVLLCEDGDRVPQRLQVLTEDGKLFSLAANNMRLDGVHGHRGDYRGSEWAGACFTQDGEWLFVNLQNPGVTFAITGPWSAGVI